MAIKEASTLSLKALEEYFFRGCQAQNVQRVGVEYEKLGLFEDSGKAIPFTGPVSVQSILKDLRDCYGWQAEFQGSWIIGLRKHDQTITLEPGGQIELSTSPSVFVDHAHQVEEQHMKEIKSVAASKGVIWCGLGLHPLARLEEITWVPKERYLIMKDVLPKRGSLAHAMMKATSSIQISVDYESQADAASKLKLAMRLSPLVTAISANSCLYEGKLVNFKSYRSHIWQNTDPDRCGIVEAALKDDFSFKDWVNYCLDVPMLFIQREGRLMGEPKITFRHFLQEGHQDHHATIEDWETHLSTLFPESRLKKWIEIRSADRQSGLLSHALPVAIKVLMYETKAREAAHKILSKFNKQELESGLAEAAKNGLAGQWGGHTLGDYAKEIMGITESASLSDFERGALMELKNRVNKKECPADEVIRCYKSKKDILSIIKANSL